MTVRGRITYRVVFCEFSRAAGPEPFVIKHVLVLKYYSCLQFRFLVSVPAPEHRKRFRSKVGCFFFFGLVFIEIRRKKGFREFQISFFCFFFMISIQMCRHKLHSIEYFKTRIQMKKRRKNNLNNRNIFLWYREPWQIWNRDNFLKLKTFTITKLILVSKVYSWSK